MNYIHQITYENMHEGTPNKLPPEDKSTKLGSLLSTFSYKLSAPAGGLQSIKGDYLH